METPRHTDRSMTANAPASSGKRSWATPEISTLRAEQTAKLWYPYEPYWEPNWGPCGGS